MNGHKEIAEWLYNLSKIENSKIDIYIDNNFAFKYACMNGHRDIAEWLYNISKADGKTINIYTDCEYAFRQPFTDKYKSVIEWLNDDYSPTDNNLIKISYKNGHMEIVKWLGELYLSLCTEQIKF